MFVFFVFFKLFFIHLLKLYYQKNLKNIKIPKKLYQNFYPKNNKTIQKLKTKPNP
ncbi:hypothetical protein AYWB_595 [Aster yellows witches'-broom phytoplasma AYWB]|uniref:Uncharacterized protein n=1 Tax=Aster yellows witches'-broom phytoplasma (strain AYWB) TaxID=322098 RepID=Q2NIN1_AYWBP|nr:hypothetical protein AYWB_595 [Aster yellows witches'-broom phytoplasma AYWB]